jgi:hypothetical protein
MKVRTSKVEFPADTFGSGSQLQFVTAKLREGHHKIRFHAFACVPGPRVFHVAASVPERAELWPFYPGDLIRLDLRPDLGRRPQYPQRSVPAEDRSLVRSARQLEICRRRVQPLLWRSPRVSSARPAAIMGGTGASFIYLGTGDIAFYSDANGNPDVARSGAAGRRSYSSLSAIAPPAIAMRPWPLLPGQQLWTRLRRRRNAPSISRSIPIHCRLKRCRTSPRR